MPSLAAAQGLPAPDRRDVDLIESRLELSHSQAVAAAAIIRQSHEAWSSLILLLEQPQRPPLELRQAVADAAANRSLPPEFGNCLKAWEDVHDAVLSARLWKIYSADAALFSALMGANSRGASQKPVS